MKTSLGAQTLIFPTPVWCVGTYDSDEKPNIMTIAWGGICCSKPPCVTVSLRAATYTFGNIQEREAYTVNVPSEEYIREADYFGIVSGREVNKFQETGLTPVRSDLVDAPYVKEFPMVLECNLIHQFKIGLHTQFIAEIMDVKVDQSCLDEEGFPDISKISPVVYATKARNYHGVGKQLGRSYKIGEKFKRAE